MDSVDLGKKILSGIRKYWYAVLILIAGVLLMLIPSDVSVPEETIPESYLPPAQESLEESLTRILSKMDGAGKVDVLLTLSQGEISVYQQNETRSAAGDSQDFRKETVILSGSDRSESGLVRQRIAPVYQGAIVLCQGADSPAVCLAIVQAVADVTGLSTDKITVLKMK